MEKPPEIPASYPDATARGTSRKLSNLTKQKFYYYGGQNPNPQKVQASVPVEISVRKNFLALYNIISQGIPDVEDSTGVWDTAAGALPNVYTLNPSILAVAMFIIKRTFVKDIKDPEFVAQFNHELTRVWPHLYAMLTKVQKKTQINRRNVSPEVQKMDVLRYIESYLTFSKE
jgi:hypothetical protein